ncbi:MAG: bifunctional phosphopantothenoylcysteine decarboxylase/phosphopantothenate--cysteine ligase CoaBC, partial [Anaerolineales bacterium]
REKQILLGVSGSIAAYKGADLASRLTQAGARVDVILTPAAEKFVSPLTYASVTGRRAYTESDLWGEQAHVLHIGLANGADLMVIAPATANTLAQLAQGKADTLLALAALACRAPILVAPAMDGGMYQNPATQENLETLRRRGVIVIGPLEGRMASGLSGVGRMEEPARLVGHVRLALGRSGPLAGKTVVVTAGGTQEPLDPVRVLANRSSGKQGFALAQAARDRGARVILITAPTHLITPVGVERLDVQTAAEMKEAVLTACREADMLLMAAAVADFRPAKAEEHKLKRGKGVPDVRLEATEDILAAVADQRKQTGRPRVVVGFAAESRDLIANARAKLEGRGLSLIVANDITAPGAGFGLDTNRVSLLDGSGSPEELPLMTKADVAEEVVERAMRKLPQD